MTWILTIAADPGLSPGQKKIIERDCGMREGKAELKVHEALAYYTKQRLGLDLDRKGGDRRTIPAGSMKSGKPHTVPLSPPAVAILRAIPRMSGPHVFGVGSDGALPFNGKSKGMKRQRDDGVAAD